MDFGILNIASSMKKIIQILFLLLSTVSTAQNVTRMVTTAGTNAYTATFNPPLTSLNSATLYVVTFTNANTSTTVTLDPAGAVAATAIKDNAGNDPAVGAIVAGGTYQLRYNGTNFRIEGTPILTLTNLPNLTIQSNDFINLQADNDIDIDADGDVKINGVSGTTNEFIGNVDGHLVWAVPPGSGGGGGAFQSAVLDVSTNDVGNVGAGEDVLWTYTLPGDTLSVDEQGIYIRVAGSTTINGNNKNIKLYFGGDLMVNPGINNLTQTWTMDCQVIRLSGTTLKSNCQVVTIGSGQTHTVLTDITETLSGDVVIQLTAEAVSNDDVIKESATVIRMEGGGGGTSVGGGDLSVADFVTSETPTGTVNGVNVTFTVANTPVAHFHFYVNGLLQEVGGGNDYTISGTTITTTTAPLTGSILSASYIK